MVEETSTDLFIINKNLRLTEIAAAADRLNLLETLRTNYTAMFCHFPPLWSVR